MEASTYAHKSLDFKYWQSCGYQQGGLVCARETQLARVFFASDYAMSILTICLHRRWGPSLALPVVAGTWVSPALPRVGVIIRALIMSDYLSHHDNSECDSQSRWLMTSRVPLFTLM